MSTPSTTSSSPLLHRIQTKEAVVAVVGLGYVGLPFAVEKAKVGFKVLGIEHNPIRAGRVNAGDNYIGDVDNAELKQLVSEGLITATTSYDRLPECDVIVICVPTPLDKNLAPDLQYVRSVTMEVAAKLRPGQLVSLESTTYPGTTEEVMLPILEQASGLRVNQDFFLAHSPERVDPGNKRYTTKNTHKVVGGVGPESLEVAVAFYSATIKHVVPVSCAKAAELCKVYENTFRAVNIAMVNELTKLCDRMDVNVWEVLDAAYTKDFGIMPFYPGPGVGGHCIPIDPHYLEWKAKEYNFSTEFIALAGRMNRSMPEFTVDKAARVLNDAGKPMRGSKIVMMGIAYKADLDDWRESPAIDVYQLLVGRGAQVTVVDSWVEEFETHDRLAIKTTPYTDSLVADADLVIVTTQHANVDYANIVAQSKLVFDTRNSCKNIADPKVVRL